MWSLLSIWQIFIKCKLCQMLKMQNVQNEYNSVSRNSNNLGQKKNSCKIDH